MGERLRPAWARHAVTAGYVAAWVAPPSALVACAVLAPWWVTGTVVLTGGAVALRWVMRIPLGGP